MKISLRSRVFALMCVMVVCSMSALTIVLKNSLANRLHQDFRSRGSVIVGYFARNSVQGIIIEDEEGLSETIEALFQIEDIVYAHIYDSERVAIVGESTIDTGVDLPVLDPTDRESETSNMILTGQSHEMPVLDFRSKVFDEEGDHIGWVRVGVNLESIAAELQSMTIQSLFLLAGFVVVGLVISFLVANSIANPINDIAAAILAFGEGDLSRTVETKKTDEVGLLAAGFNTMAGRLSLRTTELQNANEELHKEMGERKKSQAALVESEKRFQMLLENTSDWSWELDEYGVYTYANSKVKNLLGYEPEEVIGKMLNDFMNPEEAARVASEPGASTNGTKDFYRMELTCVHKDGHDVIVESSGVRILDSKSNPKGYRGVDRDITARVKAELHRKKLQEKLSRAQRMESLGVLAGGVAHDLNNILGPIVLLPELIIENLKDEGFSSSDQTMQDVVTIGASAKRAGKVVRDLVALGRRGQYDTVNLDISKLSCFSDESEVTSDLKRAHPLVEVVFVLDADHLVVSADEGQLTRAISNIVRNAAESIAGEGRVTVRLFRCVIEETYSGYEIVQEGEYAVVEVKDTGEGIEKAHLDRVFEPFFTQKKKTDRSGSGLGLSVVNGIIKDHNGLIDVQSTVDKGSTFTLYLPLMEQQKEEGKAFEDSPVVGGKERVLIVDDEPGQRFIGRRSLQRLGYELTEAENGHQALAHFEEAKKKDEESPYDLVVLDMVMEDDFDGLKTYQAILESFPKQKVLMCSGHAEDSRAKAAQDLGASWLAKPYENKSFGKAVRARLDQD